MGSLQNIPVATPETVWAILQEVAQSQTETDRRMQETDRRMQELQKTVGGITNNQGAFAEEYFFNSFENGKKNFFGEKFDEIAKHLKNRWQGVEDEYDIVLYNHASVAIIEVKYKAHINNFLSITRRNNKNIRPNRTVIFHIVPKKNIYPQIFHFVIYFSKNL
jgi:Holliday junction resolvase-like predicted endonuclease